MNRGCFSVYFLNWKKLQEYFIPYLKANCDCIASIYISISVNNYWRNIYIIDLLWVSPIIMETYLVVKYILWLLVGFCIFIGLFLFIYNWHNYNQQYYSVAIKHIIFNWKCMFMQYLLSCLLWGLCVLFFKEKTSFSTKFLKYITYFFLAIIIIFFYDKLSNNTEFL